MRRLLVLTMLLAITSVTVANAAVITILNNDGPGEGFNDPTPAVPVGGNPGLTIGEQRLNAFQYAADIWGTHLPSTVTIIVRAQFNPQTCTATSAVLGSAGPAEVWRDFIGAPLEETWYHVALANKLSGVDQNPALYDINATFNSNLNGDPACVGGRTWYYGYDGNEGVNFELLPVVLHELGHGLGFSTLVNSAGAEAGGFQDLYETFIRDNTLGLTWNDMTQAERMASAINTNNVVWNGPCVTARSPEVLGGTPTMFVHSGAGLPPKILIGTAAFGPATFNVMGNVVLVTDGVAPINDGCEAFTNGASLAGNIALIDRGLCAFTLKAAAAQAAGAIAVVIANNVASATPPALGGADPLITIPVVSVTLADGNAIKAALGGGVNVTLGFDATLLAGADASNRVKLYAPNPYAGGSSISHWDVSAFPNLLMEPAINTNLSRDVDLTLPHFHDLGWTNTCDLPVSVAISAFDARATNGGVELRAKFFSTLDDASFVIVYRANGGSDYFTGIASLTAPRNGEFVFVDETALPGLSYRYKISVIDGDGEFFSPEAEVKLPSARIELSQNSPNPFNPTTTIRFTLPANERVGLAIYAPSGALVRMLVDEVRTRGTHDIAWDGRDSAGNPVGSGVYFYRLTAGKFSDSRKMVLLK